jgi:hypothetical protein
MFAMLLIMSTPEKRMNELELFSLIEEIDPRLRESNDQEEEESEETLYPLRNWKSIFRHTLSSLQDGFFYRYRLSEEELSAMNELESSSSTRHGSNAAGAAAVIEAPEASGDRTFVYALGPRARGMLTTPAIAHAATSLCEMPPLETSKQLVEALRAEVHNADRLLRKLQQQQQQQQ